MLDPLNQTQLSILSSRIRKLLGCSVEKKCVKLVVLLAVHSTLVHKNFEEDGTP